MEAAQIAETEKKKRWESYGGSKVFAEDQQKCSEPWQKEAEEPKQGFRNTTQKQEPSAGKKTWSSSQKEKSKQFQKKREELKQYCQKT